MKEKYVPARSHFFPRSILHLGKEMSTETRENIVGPAGQTIFLFSVGQTQHPSGVWRLVHQC